MKKCILIIATAILPAVYFFTACHSATGVDNSNIPTDSLTVAKGEATFNQYCSGCHNFKQDGIGPQLGGLTIEVSADWIKHFVKNAQQVISSGDEHAVALFKKYKVAMPAFASLKDDQLDAVIAFMHTHKVIPKKKESKYGKEIANPIPAPIALSSLVINLKPLTQIPPSSDSGKLPLARITKLDFQPKTGKLFILDLRGKLYQLSANNKPSVYFDIKKYIPKFIHEPGLATGFGSFAFHPDFRKNGLLYTAHAEPPKSAKAEFGYADSMKVTLQWVLTEWKTDNPSAVTFSGRGRELMRVNFVSGIHGMQEITFNPCSKKGDEDYGMLYIGVGDGGSVENGYPFLPHHTNSIWGTVLRIDPTGNNSANKQYGIPPHNPFAQNKEGKTLGEIYAYGFRNPHRITWTSTGQMLVSNVGQANIESINLILPGHDYGWPIREGEFLVDPFGELNKVYALPANDSAYNITYPVAEYDHDEGKAISGGFEYTGSLIPALKGKYLFGDIPSGRLFFIDIADISQGKLAVIKEWKITINNTPANFKTICGNRVDLHFGKDAKGELYILTKADGSVYKLTGASF